jgi:tetratricopeptide (TPR) repeat protein
VKNEAGFANAADASFYAGVINYQKNNFEEAYQDFKRIEDHPYYKNEAPNWIISSLYQLKKYDELLAYGEKLSRCSKEEILNWMMWRIVCSGSVLRKRGLC